SVTERIFDKDGGVFDCTAFVLVKNVSPTAGLFKYSTDGSSTSTSTISDGELLLSANVKEGSSFTISAASITDPSQADTDAKFRFAYEIDGVWQNGGYPTYFDSGTDPSFTHTFDDGPATHTVTERIFDKNGGFFDCVATITVDNVAPTAG